MKNVFLKVLFVSALVFGSCESDDDGSPTVSGGGGDDFFDTASADYSLNFQTLFTEESFPTDYPDNPTFGTIVAITHTPEISVYQIGQLASEGLQAYAEDGDVNALAAFISADIGEENEGAFSIVTATSIGPNTSTTMDVSITPSRTRITFLAKLNPSPDWFVGLSSFDVIEGDDLVDDVTFNLGAIDAGTAAGNTYNAPDETETANVSAYQGSPFGDGPFSSNLATITITRDE
jgi:hypothetical protein